MPCGEAHGTLSMVINDVFAQDGYRLRLEWAAEGVAALAAHCAVLVIVDVLSFSTSVDVALGRGGRVFPMPRRDDPKPGEAVLAGDREWTLRPASLETLPSGTLLALPSPNGATLSARAGVSGAVVMTACLRNASTVAQAAFEVADGAPIGLIPAGERWGVTSGPLRPGIEDLLGAGAVAAALVADDHTGASPEVRLAATTYLSARQDVRMILKECSSGRELIEAGHLADVELAALVNHSSMAPVLRDGVYEDRIAA